MMLYLLSANGRASILITDSIRVENVKKKSIQTWYNIRMPSPNVILSLCPYVRIHQGYMYEKRS